MPKINAETRADRRQRLVDAAWRRVAAAGYHETTVDDVCAEAGVSKGAFYGYFDTKQDLFLALLDEETDALDRVARELANSDVSGAERMRGFTRAMLEVGDDPGRVQLRADLWSALATDPVIRTRVRGCRGASSFDPAGLDHAQHPGRRPWRSTSGGPTPWPRFCSR